MANELLAHKADLPEITAVFGASFSDIYEFVTPAKVKYSALQKRNVAKTAFTYPKSLSHAERYFSYQNPGEYHQTVSN